MIRWRGITSILTLVLAVGSSALARVSPVAAVTSTVIEDAVVVLNLHYADAWDWEGGEVRYFDWNNDDWYGSEGYRLPSRGRAQYISGFGGGNQSAVVTSDGGCAVKSATGAVWCFGRNSLDGDGTRRDIPVPRIVPGIAASNLEYVSAYSSWGLQFDPRTGDGEELSSFFNFNGICVLTTSGNVSCWGKNGSQSILAPTTIVEGNVAQLDANGAITTDGRILGWSSLPIDGESEIALRQIGQLPVGTSVGAVNIEYAIQLGQYSYQYSYKDLNFSVQENRNVPQFFGMIDGVPVTLLGWGLEPLATTFAGQLSAVDELNFGVLPSDPALADAYSHLSDVEIRELEIAGDILPTSSALCIRDEQAIICARDWEQSYFENDGSITQDGSNIYYWNQSRRLRMPKFQPRFLLAVGSIEGSGNAVATREWACSILATNRVSCGPVAWYETPDPADSHWVYSSDAFVRNDRNLDGYLTLGTEMPINCGVGFQCDFDAENLSISGNYVTAIGTLTRTPRTSVTVSGSVGFDDGTAVSGGTVSWRSSDGLLSSSTTIQPNGSFSLSARSGDGRISFGVNYGDYVGCPAAWSEVEVVDLEQPACVTQLESATIDVALTGSLTGRQVTLPTVVGESRTISLRFGDGETPIAGVRLSGSAQGECVITEAVGLGGLYACPSYYVRNQYGERPTLKTDADGTATIWMPTGEDVALTASMIEADGITWSDTLDSFYDDGPNPDPYLFPGLIVAETPEPMTILRGHMATVDSAVLVDGIDPAYGLNAALEPVDAVNSTCASSDELQDTSDEVGEVTFTACPSGTGEWRVVSTDGSFFPSAPFEITVTSPPMVSSISPRGATLDEAFSPSDFSYEGYFTGSSVRFTVRLQPDARRARVRAAACRRPTSGERSCTVSVTLNGVTDVYTFNLRQNP
jgi:hypothetical protein